MKTTGRTWLVFLCFGVVSIYDKKSILVDALSLHMNLNKEPISSTTTSVSLSRRNALAVCFGSASSLPVLSVFGHQTNHRANAACITGDSSPDCIGQFKESIPYAKDGLEDIRMSYGAMRPDHPPIILATPKSFVEALGMLNDQRLAMDDMERLVALGNLKDAGVLLLRVLPNITVAGRFVIAAAPQIQSTFLEQAEELAKAVDMTIARGLKGNMGAPAVAQLSILSDLAQAKLALDDLIKVAGAVQ